MSYADTRSRLTAGPARNASPATRDCNLSQALGEKVMVEHAGDKHMRIKRESEGDPGYLIGINAKTTEYFISEKKGILSCANIRRLPDYQAFSPEMLQDSNFYIMEGSGSTPIGVRIAAPMPSNPNTDAVPDASGRARKTS